MGVFIAFTLFLFAALAPAQVLTATKILSGSSNDAATAVAVDSQGNVFVAGSTTSPDFPIVNGLIPHIPEASVRISTDGHTFAASSLTPSTVLALAATADGHTLLAAAPDGLYRSTDSGATWSGPQMSFPAPAVALAIDPVNPLNAYALVNTATNSNFYRSTDGGLTWQQAGSAQNPSLYFQIVVDPQNPGTLYTFFSQGLYRTTDYGSTWQLIQLPAAYSPSGQASATNFAFAPSQPQTIYAITYLSPLLKSVDGGLSWVVEGTPTLPVLPNEMAVDPKNPNMVWFVNGAGIQRTLDGGATVQTVLSLPGASWEAVVVDPSNSSHIFAAGYRSLYSSLDGGATWNVVATGQFTGLLATPLAIFASAQVTPALFLAKLDPSLSQVLFSTFIGPVAAGIEVFVDSAGNPLVTGVTQAIDFPTTPNALNSTFTGTSAGFAVKVKADGSSLLYSTFLGDLAPVGAAFDSAGNAVIVGATQGSAQTTSKSFQPSPPGGCGQPTLFGQLFQGDIAGHSVAAKLSADGTQLLWGTYLAGSCGDTANAVQLDSSGNAYITGVTASLDFPVTTAAMTLKYPGLNTSGFISELSADGSSLLYSSFFGAGANNSGNAIALDGHGNVFIGGFTQAKASAGALSASKTAGCQPIFFIGPTEDTSFQGNDGFVMKMTLSSAPPIWLATIGGSCQDTVSSLTIDGAGDIWVSGYTASADFPTLAPIGALGTGSSFLAAIDRTGSNLLFSSFTASFNSQGTSAADASQGAYFAGTTPMTYKPAAGGGATSALMAHIDLSQIIPISLDSIQPPVPKAMPGPPYLSAATVAPGQLLVLTGRNIGPANAVFAKLGPDGRLPFTLAGAQVLFGGVPAALISVQANQIECQAPFELTGSLSTTIQVQYNGQTSNSFAATVVEQQPIVLAVSNSDGTPNSASNPASVGSFVAIYLTGFGQTIPGGIDGGVNIGAGIVASIAPPNVSINGLGAQPAYLGDAPGESTAVFQLNLQVPAPPAGSNSDSVNISSRIGSNQAPVTVYVK